MENLLQREIHLFLSGEGHALFGKTLNTASYMRGPADAPVPKPDELQSASGPR